MRCILFMIPRVYQPGTPPHERAGEHFAPPVDAVERMMKFNEDLANAGALIALDGLHPPSKGGRVLYSSGPPRVAKGDTANAKEVIGGFWMIRVESMEEAIGWAKRIPAAEGDVVEIRQVFEMSDFPDEVQKAADNPAVESAIAPSRNNESNQGQSRQL